MFDISFSELLVIGAIALIVIGPARLPGVARTVGHLLGRAQRYVNDVKADIRREVELDELRKLKEQMDAAAQDVQTSVQAGEAALRETQATLQEGMKVTDMMNVNAPDMNAPALMTDASTPVSGATPDAPPPPSSTRAST